MDKTDSEIISFFKGKNIFLTGATGFVGKLLIDQILRKCEPNKLNLLIRTKKGIEPQKRLDQLFEDVVYERLKKEKPDFHERIELINGDLSADNFGLNEESKQKLIDNVNIVIHGGATVRFDEPIKLATKINVKGTLSIIELCHQIKNLKAFVYISTAFSNCPYKEIKEEFYAPPINCTELIKITEQYDEQQLENMSFFGKWPNSYSLTKAVAENAICNHAKGLPVCVFRPAIIVGTLSEPVAGWIDNIYGPTGLLAGTAAGVIRVIQADPKAVAEIVPADMVAFALMAATYKTSLMGSTMEIPIYNYVSVKENPLTWYDYTEFARRVGDVMPLEQNVWTHYCTLQPNAFIFAIYSFFLHFIPAMLVDFVLLILNKNTCALKMFKKGKRFMGVLAYFATQTWTFSNNNVQALWAGLNKTDQELFNFNMATINWEEYFKDAIPGVRLYIFKETPNTIPAALKKQRRQKLIQNVIVNLFYGLLIYMLWKLGSSMLAATA